MREFVICLLGNQWWPSSYPSSNVWKIFISALVEGTQQGGRDIFKWKSNRLFRQVNFESKKMSAKQRNCHSGVSLFTSSSLLYIWLICTNGSYTASPHVVKCSNSFILRVGNSQHQIAASSRDVIQYVMKGLIILKFAKQFVLLGSRTFLCNLSK